jgi:hypothetical protein
MTIGDVAAFYTRRDAAEATGKEEPCTGCDKQLEEGEPYSDYDVKDTLRAPRAFPQSIVLCQKCAYMVIAWRPPATPDV